jgi:uncharacterized membrane protein
VTTAPVQLIVAAFNDPEEAGRLLDDLKLGRRVGLIGIVDAAAVVKDAEGELRITNAKHRGRRGFLTGGALGGALAVLSGPLGWGTAAATGAIGALIGRARNAPFKASLEDLATSLPPDSSLLVAMVEHRWVEAVEAAAAELGARVVREEMKADIREQLEAGGNLTFTMGQSELGVGVARLASDADGGLEVGGALASDDGVLFVEAELTDEELPPGELADEDADDAPDADAVSDDGSTRTD